MSAPTNKTSPLTTIVIALVTSAIFGYFNILFRSKAHYSDILANVSICIGVLMFGTALFCGASIIVSALRKRGVSVAMPAIYISSAVMVMLAGSVYWFAIRPDQINKHCSAKALSYATQRTNSDQNEAYLTAFDVCRHNNGI